MLIFKDKIQLFCSIRNYSKKYKLIFTNTGIYIIFVCISVSIDILLLYTKCT